MNTQQKNKLYNSIMSKVAPALKESLEFSDFNPEWNRKEFDKARTLFEKYQYTEQSFDVETPEDAYENLNDILWMIAGKLGYFDAAEVLYRINPNYYDDPTDSETVNPDEERDTVLALCYDYQYIDLLREYYENR